MVFLGLPPTQPLLHHQFSVLPCNKQVIGQTETNLHTTCSMCYVRSSWLWQISTACLLGNCQAPLENIHTDAMKLPTLNLPWRWTSPLSNRPLLLGYLLQQLFHCWMHLILCFDLQVAVTLCLTVVQMLKSFTFQQVLNSVSQNYVTNL
jgi:hypothetical protein